MNLSLCLSAPGRWPSSEGHCKEVREEQGADREDEGEREPPEGDGQHGSGKACYVAHYH